MRIYLQPPQASRGLQRIADALIRYAPSSVEIVDSPLMSDLVVIYAIGRCERVTQQAVELKLAGKRLAIIQVCLRSTQKPNTWDWLYLWEMADVIWSYYDLQEAMAVDGVVHDPVFPFYHAPLGADAEVFYPRPLAPIGLRDFTVLTSGESRLSESVRECFLAAKSIGGITAHIGASGEMTACTSNYRNQTDDQLAWIYSQCQFVSGLRRKEGFELPAVEGLLCGARPIVFKGADWEFNYGHHAIYIEETDRQGVIDQLIPIFKHGAPPVTPEERERAVERYNWETIIKGFYDRLQ